MTSRLSPTPLPPQPLATAQTAWLLAVAAITVAALVRLPRRDVPAS